MALSPLDIHNLISQGLQTFGSFISRDWQPEEIDLQYNKSKVEFIDDLLDRAKGLGYQDSQRLLDSIRELEVVNAELTPIPATGRDNVLEITLPAAYKHLIKSRSKVTYSCIDEQSSKVVKRSLIAPNRLVDSNLLDVVMTDSFSTTDRERPVTVIANTKLYVYITPSFNITKIYLDYIKIPNILVLGLDGNGDYNAGASTNCELSDSSKILIINRVVKYLSNVNDSDPNKIRNLQIDTKTS